MSAIRVARGVIVDVVLAAAAAALSWHPVYGFLQAHPALVFWAVGAAHIALAPILTMHAFTGGSQARDLVLARQGRAHGLVFRASNVAILTLGFFVPALCARALPGAGSPAALAFSAVVWFAPYLFVALVFAPRDLGRAVARRTKPLFDTRGGRLLFGFGLTVYLVLMESTMFLCVESNERAKYVVALLGLVLSYLPTRLAVFYLVTKSESRTEVASLFFSTVFLAAQLVLG